jgi:hypothetical protein
VVDDGAFIHIFPVKLSADGGPILSKVCMDSHFLLAQCNFCSVLVSYRYTLISFSMKKIDTLLLDRRLVTNSVIFSADILIELNYTFFS